MKKVILSFGAAIIIIAGSVTFISCGNSVEKNTTTEQEEEVYSCPMHPEITGKAGDTCSECGMDLTE